MSEKNMKFSGKNAKFSEKKQSKCLLICFGIEKATFSLILTGKIMPINRVAVFSLIHHLGTQIWWVPNFNEGKVDPATL